MLIIMKQTVQEAELNCLLERIQDSGLTPHLSQNGPHTTVGIIGDRRAIMALPLEDLAGIEKVIPITSGLKLVSRKFQPADTVIDVGGVKIGGPNPVVMAGPCAVESREQLLEAARIVKQAGAQILRGGAFKPRTSPYSFQGLEKIGLEYLAEVRELTGLKIVTEVMDPGSVELVAGYADILQIGARNMQNFTLLREVGRTRKPVLLKRGISATIEEWLSAAEYILNEGNFQVALCERGIRTFETYTRNTLDLAAVAVAKQLSHLPVLVDPSHGTGRWELVRPMALAALAAGADGLIIEVHPNPAEALSDGPQSLKPENFSELMQELDKLAPLVRK